MYRIAHLGHFREHCRCTRANEQVGTEANRRVRGDTRKGVRAATLHTDNEVRGRACLTAALVQGGEPPVGHRHNGVDHGLEAFKPLVLQTHD